LKHAGGVIDELTFSSRPARARGLKLSMGDDEFNEYVAPRAGAWIETPSPSSR